MQSLEYTSALKLIKSSMITQSDTFDHFIFYSERKKFIQACIEVKSLIDWQFKLTDFFDVISSCQNLSLEFLWLLHILQVMPLEIYILKLNAGEETFLKFQESVVDLYIKDLDDKEQEYFIQTGLLSFFVHKAFPVTDVFNSEKRLKEVCLDTIEKFLKELFSAVNTDIGTKRYSGFFSLWNAGILEETNLEAFCFFAVNYYLKSLCPSSDLDLFRIFENSEPISSSQHLMTLLIKLIKGQTYESVIHILKMTIQDLTTNASSILNVVRAVIESNPGSLPSIQMFLSKVLNQGIEGLNYNLALRALLIMRQASYQTNTAQHICYKNWLQMVFKDNRILKNIECFSLLMQVLSDIVPFYKDIEVLKVAIDYTISATREAQHIYNDYIILLKTRIDDLKPQVKTEDTVEKILSLYEMLGKIPPIIMEVSLLQKHKFMNEFLPVLLKPRLIPQSPDVKEKFINALYKAGKIPDYLMQNYKRKCQEEMDALLSDVNMINDNFDEDSDIIVLE